MVTLWSLHGTHLGTMPMWNNSQPAILAVISSISNNPRTRRISVLIWKGRAYARWGGGGLSL